MKRPFLMLSALCLLVTVSMVSCYVGVPNAQAKGEWPAVLIGLIFAALAGMFWFKRDEPMS